eukprot:gene5417-3859_t
MSNRRLEKRKQAIKDQTVDPWFTPDWAYVRKKVDDKEVNLRNFEEIWKALIFANNDWRMIPSGSVTIFSRAQRLRLDNLDEFIEEYDYFVGDEVDVAIDDVYCPATIIAVTQTYVRIHYLGWEDPSYDTNIHDMGILYPPFSYVQRVKIWAGLSNRIPYWPCVAYIRPAVNNLPVGVAYLKSEKCIFVIPAMKHLPELAEWAAGRWIDTYSFQAFSKNFTRKKLLQPSLENFLETAMFELENDPHSRAVSALRFVGSYEHYTSVELWKEEKKGPPKVGSKRPQPSPSALETTTNGFLLYRSKKMRRECRVVLAKAPNVPRENYATLCTSVLAMHQLSADDGGGMSVKEAFKEAVRQNLKLQNNATRDGSEHQHPHQPSQVMATYILGDVGCRLKFQY